MMGKSQCITPSSSLIKMALRREDSVPVDLGDYERVLKGRYASRLHKYSRN